MQKVHTCYPFHYGITCHITAKNHYKGGQLTELSSLYNNPPTPMRLISFVTHSSYSNVLNKCVCATTW